jgi:peptidyl-tRNA hydrolase
MFSRKLYICVRRDLSKSQQAVQAAHAVGLFCSEEFRRFHWDGREINTVPARWDNESLVLLRAENLQELQDLHKECGEAWAFHEPDLDGEMTAFAVLTPPDWFGSLPLL